MVDAPALRNFIAVQAKALGLILSEELWPILDCAARQMIVIGGWRAGKSTVLAFLLFIEAVILVARGDRALIWLVGSEFDETEGEFDYLYNWALRLNLLQHVSMPQEGTRSLVLGHPTQAGQVRIETKSGSQPERLGRVAPDLIGVCEAGHVSEAVRQMLIGRSAEKRCRIIYSGTLIEDDRGRRTWAWYQELAQAWRDDPSAEHAAFSLPSWANRVVYPGGRDDPEIQYQERELGEYLFKRQIAAEPTGVQFQAYSQLEDGKQRLAAFPAGAKVIGAAGGIDYGDFHPTALVILQLTPDELDQNKHFVGPRGIAWVRECFFTETDPGDTAVIQKQHKLLSERWRCSRWATDPNERFMARSYAAQAVSGSRHSREHRIGLVTARLRLDKLMFDAHGRGVPQLYEEMRGIHFRRLASGAMELVRRYDDRTAALEDAVDLVDGRPRHAVAPRRLVYSRRLGRGRPLREFAAP